MGTRRTEAESASLFGWEAAAPVAVVPLGPDPWAVTDELGTAPMFAAPVHDTPTRHARLDCTWPDESESGVCGRRAVVAYESAQYGSLPRCRRHHTVAAQRRAQADGWTVKELYDDMG